MMNIRRKKNLNRRIFIKKISGLTAGAFLFFPFVTGKVKAHTISNPVKAPFKPEPSSWKDDEINVSWIGHATMLINFYGTIIITDPVLYERIGVYMFGLTIGPARYTEPA